MHTTKGPKQPDRVTDGPNAVVSFAKGFGKFYEQKLFHDLVLNLGDEEFYCHRLIVAYHSKTIEKQIEEQRESKQRTSIDLPPVIKDKALFEQVVQFMYTGA